MQVANNLLYLNIVKMKHPYQEYETSELWDVVKSSIEDLVENNDIELSTPIEYVVGYICKNISSTDISSGENQTDFKKSLLKYSFTYGIASPLRSL